MNLIELKKIKHQSFKQILKSTVETTRATLKCDRVIIYDADNLPQAKVIAESKNEKCVSLLGQAIQDPFLEGDYLEMYCYGMSLTIDNIYASDVRTDKLQELEKLGVKSIAVAPIYHQNKLIAFLIAHQCDQIQPWIEATVNLLAEKASTMGATLSGIAEVDELAEFIEFQEMGNNYSHQDNRMLLAADSNQNQDAQLQQQMIQQKNNLFAEIEAKLTEEFRSDLLQIIVADIRRLLKCDRILVYSLNASNYGVVIAESVAEGRMAISAQSAGTSEVATQYLEEDRDGKVRVWNNTSDEEAPSWYREQLEALEVKAGLVAPIANNGQLFGLLIAHQCSNTRNWQQQEIYWITQIANHIGNMPEYTQISNGNRPEQLIDFQQQLEQERMWTKHFSDVLQQIRQSFKVKDILKSSVREVQKVLNCDRVLIYALNHNNYGKIVAESVSPGWTKTEGTVIKDPCFESRYLAKYRDGRVRAWNNIHEAGMSNCYVEQLEKLEVKANLVVPIIIEEKLFGLLVAHQCSQPRRWRQTEILWLTQIATHVGFALDNAQLLADAQRLRLQAESEKMWTEYFTDAVQQIRQSLKQKDVLKASVREVKRVFNCDRVVVYALDQDNYGKIVAEAVTHGWTRSEGRIIKDPCFEARYLDQYRDGRVRAWENIYEAGMSNCHIEQLAQLEVKANLVAPIINQGKLFGLLVAHQCSDTRQWQQAEIRWISQIAAQVGLALDNAQLLAQLEQYTQDTQAILERSVNSSSMIKRTVENVTAGFEALSNSCESFAENIQQVKDISKQLAQQSMGMARAVNLTQGEGSNQNSVIDLSDQIFSLMQELFEATAKIDPLFTSIKAEITSKTTTLQTETEQLLSGVDDFATAGEKLEQIVALNYQMSNLIKNISDSLDNQIQSSTFAQKSVHELTNITMRISQQSMAMIKSLNEYKFD